MRKKRNNISAAIAWRFLISKKSHGTVGTISTVSVCAMAVATAAIVCVLSVFNGFHDIIGGRLDTLSPDVMVTPAKGKTILAADSLARELAKRPGVASATPTLSENALVIFNSREMPVKLKGVTPEEYMRVTDVTRTIQPEEGGRWFDARDNTSGEEISSPAVLAIGTAARLGAFPGDGMLLFAPRRKGRVNIANPASSFMTDSLDVIGVYRTNQSDYDEDGVILPIATARRLLQYDTEASAIEIAAAKGVDAPRLAKDLQRELGSGFEVKDRLRQQEMNFRMVSIEKWVSFLLLFFILVIASFNILSSLSMLVLEKEHGLRTLHALGMSRGRIGAVFGWESIYVALAGGISGIIIGVALCLLQQHFGFIKFNGNAAEMTVSAYPVSVHALDLAVTMIPVLAIGICTALVTSRFAISRIRRGKL